MSSITILLLIFGLLSTLLDAKIFLSPRKSGWKKVVLSSAKVIIFIIVFLLSIAKEIYDANQKAREQLKSAAEKLQIEKEERKRDSTNAKAYIDSLDRFNKAGLKNLQTFSLENTKLLAQFGLKNDSNQKKIVRIVGRIDTTKTKSLPNITNIPGGKLVVTLQKNDTLYFTIYYYNSGESDAINLKINAYYLFERQNNVYEFNQPLITADNTVIQAKNDLFNLFMDGKNCIPNFRFDSSLDKQFVLILGTYTNDSPTPIQKNLSLCYAWNVNTRTWGIYGSTKDIERVHFDKRIKHF